MVQVTVNNESLVVKAPYDSEFINRSKQLGGKWHGDDKTWLFELRHEARVRKLCVDVYGTDGSPATSDTATINISLSGREGDTVKVGGFTVLSKRYRDRAPVVANNAAVIKGKLLTGGGSRRNPEITFEEGTIIEAINIPLPLARRLAQENPAKYVIAEESSSINDFNQIRNIAQTILDIEDWGELGDPTRENIRLIADYVLHSEKQE